MNFDLAFIGAGPSTMFSLLHLVNNGYKGNIIVIEKGKSLDNRTPDEIISGSFGAGCYSDSKISKGLEVGGTLKLSQGELDNYGEEILNYIKQFDSNGSSIMWEENKPFNTSPSNLTWSTLSVSHIGTERGRSIYKNIEHFLKSKFNISFHFEEEVIDIIDLSNGSYQLITSKGEKKNAIRANKVIIATGQKSSFPEYIIKRFNLKSFPRALQLGVRVEDQINDQYRDILNANYDFKFVGNYIINGLKIRVRTFCCNSGNAHTCAENNKEGFICFNGHAYKKPDPNNNSVNYGIICEVEGYKGLESKESQIELMQSINQIPSWSKDNFEGEIVSPQRELLKGFPQLVGYYPDEVIEALNTFVDELSKIVDLSKAKYLYPEVKLSGNSPYLKEGYETEKPNLYMIGDCALSRGILKAGIMGIQFAENILKEGVVK